MARYRNKFHNPHDAAYGPEFFEVGARPTEYKGFKIYRRNRSVFDCVIDGSNGPEVIGMYAGLNGAKGFIDEFWARENQQ